MTNETQTNGSSSSAAQQSPSVALSTETAAEDGRAISAFSSEANFTGAQRMAKALAASSLVPEAYRNNIPNVLIAMELANRIGASVFAVMQNLDIIHGRPSWRATFLIATVNACGRFTPLRFRFQGTEGKADWGCRAVAKDRDSGEECIGALITMSLANAEGWTKKAGSKWLTMPEQMLMYRAAGFWTRVYAPELSLGMQTADEARDVYGDPGELPVGTAAVQGDAKALEQALMGAVAPAPTSSPSVAGATVVAPAEDAKAAKKGKPQATLPTGNLLPATPAMEDVERDPYGQPVPPMREPGID